MTPRRYGPLAYVPINRRPPAGLAKRRQAGGRAASGDFKCEPWSALPGAADQAREPVISRLSSQRRRLPRRQPL
jgi:hypothetical protein